MLRTDRFKYILSETGPDLLYDLDDDPSEQRDRGDDPGLAGRAELKERLFEWFRDRSNETTLDLQRQLRSSEHGPRHPPVCDRLLGRSRSGRRRRRSSSLTQR